MPPPSIVSTLLFGSILCWEQCCANVGKGATPIETKSRLTSSALKQVLEQHLARCHVVFVTQDANGQEFSTVLRISTEGNEPAAVVSIGHLNSTSGARRANLLRYIVLGDVRFTCNVLVLVLGSTSSSPGLLGDFLEEAELHFRPHIHIIGVGRDMLAAKFLLHKSLRNTIHAIFLASALGQNGSKEEESCEGCGERVLIYSRCLYCLKGNAGARVIDAWTPGKNFHRGSDIFPDKYEDMMGHTIQVTSKDLFPFIEYQLNSQELGTTVTPLDSVDVRMLNITAKVLNFTYVMRMPADDEWGTLTDGKWSGMVYSLQQNLADISTMLFWSYERKQAIDFTRIYANEPYVMVTRKPKPAPQHLALIRPFSGEVWLSVFFAAMGSAVVFWALQKVWASFSGFPSISFSTALMNIWSNLLEDSVPVLSLNDAGRMFMGFWLLFTILIVTLYTSSLIAYLSVPVTPPPINTIPQLLKVKGATWGMEPGAGLGWLYFKDNDNADVRGMFDKLLVLETDEQMRRVLDGYHALFTWKYYIKTIIASNFTTALGYTPIHISQEEFMPGPTGWGVRKGAPFLSSLNRIQDKLVEAGVVNYWLQELFATAVQKGSRIRKQKILAGEEQENTYLQETSQEGAVVLSMTHLQGAFYLLALGIALSVFAAIGENVVHATWKA